MSRLVFNEIVNEVLASLGLHVSLSEVKRESLYLEILHYFGLIGATDECEALETAWRDSYNRHEITEYIKAWLKRKPKRKSEQEVMVV